MKPLWSRLLRHALIAGISLAIVGYFLGRAFLFTHRMYAGGAHNPENERVLWQTPLVLAAIGIVLTAGLGLLTAFVRRPVKAPVTDSPANA